MRKEEAGQDEPEGGAQGPDFIGSKAMLRILIVGFPGGPLIENPPANAGDTASVPDPGRSHMSQGNSACVPQLLSLCSRVRELQLQKPTSPRAHSKRTTAMRKLCIATRE